MLGLLLAMAVVAPLLAAAPAEAQGVRRSTAETTAAQWAAIRRGVEVMKSRDAAPRTSADWRRSWQFWANLHQHFGTGCRGPVTGGGMAGVSAWTASNNEERATWCRSEHGDPQFLTWHRMALFFFERVLAQAAGVPGLRLPYWDLNATPTLPAQLRERTYIDAAGRTVPNPLFVANRAAGMNAGTASVSAFARSAANAMTATGYAAFNTRVENTPHGSGHCAIVAGCPNGYMGSTASAALDPIFWLHHANIDRLYECWLGGSASRLPSDPALLDERYSFVDADGRVVSRTVRSMLTAAQLGYGYQGGTGCGAAGAAPAAVALSQGADLRLAQAGSADRPRGKPGERRVEPGARVEVEAPKTRGRKSLRIEDVVYEQQPGVMYEVWLVAPDGREAFAGLMSDFGAEARKSRDFDFDVTDALRQLGLPPGEEPAIEFRPTTGLEETGARTMAAQPRAAPAGRVTFGDVSIE